MKVNLHGHLNVSFEPYWLERFGLTNRNIAEAATQACIKKGIGVYAVTSDSDENFSLFDRFGFVWNHARTLPQKYRQEGLGENAFVVERKRDGKKVIFINGQSVKVKDEKDGTIFEILTFGTNQIPNFRNWQDTYNCLCDNGLPVIAEHPLCTSHYGMGRQRLEQFCQEEKLTAVEHNAQLTLPDLLFSRVPKFSSFTRKRNDEARETAEQYRTPIIANDDSNAISHIGTAYIEFDDSFLNINNDKIIKQDLINIILDGNFRAVMGYLPIRQWLKWAIWEIQLREHILGCKKRWERKHL